MSERTNRKAVAIRFEGTISPHANRALFDVGDEIDPKVAELLKTHWQVGDYITIVTEFANIHSLMGEVQRFLIHNGVDFHDIWAQYGFPECDVYYDNRAEKIQ